MKIYLWGQRNFFGGGVHFASFCDAMKRLNFFGGQVQEVDMKGQDLQVIAGQTTAQDIHVLFFPLREQLSLQGFIVKWGIFEADVLPDHYIDYLSNSHLIWVPSQWARQVLIAHGIEAEKIDVVPEGVDPNVFHPFTRDMMVKDDVFRFYMFGKKEDRKGFSELLQGFRLAFDNDPSVLLCLKADNFWSDQVRKTDKNAEVRQEVEQLGLTNVKPITGQLQAQQLSLIYSYCDALAFPTRAEGWGLPLGEAIACGLPAITNFHSGQTEYLSPVKDKISCLDFTLEKITCPDFISAWGEGGSWAVATPETIAEAMVDMRENYDSWREKALQASDVIRSQFSWERAADKAISSLKEKGIITVKINLQI